MKKKDNATLGRHGANKNGRPRWKSRFYDYQADELSLLTFASDDDIDAAIDLVWVGKLQGMPFNLAPDGDSLVVPKISIPYFTKAGLRFTPQELRS